MKKKIVYFIAFLTLLSVFTPNLLAFAQTPAPATPVWKEKYDPSSKKITLVFTSGSNTMEFSPWAGEGSVTSALNNVVMASAIFNKSEKRFTWWNLGASTNKYILMQEIPDLNNPGTAKVTGIYNQSNSMGGMEYNYSVEGMNIKLYDVASQLANGADTSSIGPTLKLIAQNIKAGSQTGISTFIQQRAASNGGKPLAASLAACTGVSNGVIGPVFFRNPRDTANEQAWLDFIKKTILDKNPNAQLKTALDVLFNPNGGSISLGNADFVNKMQNYDKEVFERYYAPTNPPAQYPTVPLTNKLVAELNNDFTAAKANGEPMTEKERKSLIGKVWENVTSGLNFTSTPDPRAAVTSSDYLKAFAGPVVWIGDWIYSKYTNSFNQAKFNADFANSISPLLKMWLAATYATYNEKFNECIGKQNDPYSVTNQALIAQANALAASASTYPGATGSSDPCEAPSGGSAIMNMIKSAICGLIQALKDGADAFFTLAMNWLKASLGVTQNKDVTLPTGDLTSGSSPGGASATPTRASVSVSLSAQPTIPDTFRSDLTTAAQSNNGYVDAGIVPINSSGQGVTSSAVPGSVKITGSGSSLAVNVFSQVSLTPLPGSNKFAVQFIVNDKGYQFDIASDGSNYKPSSAVKQLSNLPTIPSPISTTQQASNQCPDAAPTGNGIQDKAKNLCNSCKPNFDEANWNKGPCLSKNVSNYAIDVAHNPRNDEIDNANTCGNPNQFVELDLNCNVIRAYPSQ